ncbi:MAG: hypothetical protein WDM88_13415 [Galbitalea sp.]
MREFTRTAHGNHRGSLQLDEYSATPLNAESVRMVRYLGRLEGATMEHLRNLLVTATHKGCPGDRLSRDLGVREILDRGRARRGARGQRPSPVPGGSRGQAPPPPGRGRRPPWPDPPGGLGDPPRGADHRRAHDHGPHRRVDHPGRLPAPRRAEQERGARLDHHDDPRRQEAPRRILRRRVPSPALGVRPRREADPQDAGHHVVAHRRGRSRAEDRSFFETYVFGGAEGVESASEIESPGGRSSRTRRPNRRGRRPRSSCREPAGHPRLPPRRPRALPSRRPVSARRTCS